MTEQTKTKSSALRRGVTAVIVLAVVFALLIVGYFLFLKPYLTQYDAEEVEPIELIWSQEVATVENRVLMYEHFERDQMQSIEIHNPGNEKYGSQYVDWGFFRYTGQEEYEGLYLTEDQLYLIGFEYVEEVNAEMTAQVVTAVGQTLATSRVEDHCTDFSKYGLDYASPEEATSVTLTLLDGRVFTFYIGDKLPSGTGYYVRCMNEDTPVGGGEAVVRDSVYVISSLYLDSAILVPPQKLVEPYMAMPIITTNRLYDNFAIWRKEDRYFSPKLDENGNQEYNENGEAIRVWDPMVLLRPLNDLEDPFSLFSGMSVYEAVVPQGYYGSSGFEQMLSIFGDFKGEEVVELGQKTVDENGKINYEISDEVFERYGLKDYYYQLEFTFDDIPNVIYVSEKQDDGYYYVYSLNLCVIVKATEEQLYFLNWSPETYIQRRVFNVYIDDCESISIEGSYYDAGIENPDRKGEVSVKDTFTTSSTGTALLVKDSQGNPVDTDNYRCFFRYMLQAVVREEVDPEDVKAAMENDPMATISVKTRQSIQYKYDSTGKLTNTVDYVLDSVTKVYRFYQLTNGRALCTIQNINAEGKELTESGSFYVLTVRVEELLSAAVDLQEGIAIDYTARR